MDFVGIDKLSLLDYEGYCSAVLFSKECNFKCPFCHNGLTVLQSETYIPFDEILEFLKSRIGLLDAVVFSGGEPTLMSDLKEKIIEVRNLGFKIKLDTNGTNPEVLKDLINNNLLDYVAMDIKNSPKMYIKTTTCPSLNIESIKSSIDILMNSNIKYEFRTTLVEELHSLESIEEMGEFIKGADKLYLQKFVEHEGVFNKNLHEVQKERAEEYKKILNKSVKDVNLRGY